MSIPIISSDNGEQVIGKSLKPVQDYMRVGMLQLKSLPPLSLYIHLPWCLKKCPYCDFNSHEPRGEAPQQQYLDALMAASRDSADTFAKKARTIVNTGDAD